MSKMSELSMEDFVIAYMEAWKAKKTMADLAKELGILRNSIADRKNRLNNQHGVKLPGLGRGGKPRVNVKTLQAIIQDYEMGRR